MSPVIPIPEVKGHLADPVKAYSLPTTHHNQALIIISSGEARTVVTIPMLASGLKIMLYALNLDMGLYSLHSLKWWRGAQQPTGQDLTTYTH